MSGQRIQPGCIARRSNKTARSLAVGELGTVTELVGAGAARHTYVLAFDTGYQLEVVLPAPSLVELTAATTANEHQTGPRRYVAAPRRTLVGLARSLVHALRPSLR